MRARFALSLAIAGALAGGNASAADLASDAGSPSSFAAALRDQVAVVPGPGGVTFTVVLIHDVSTSNVAAAYPLFTPAPSSAPSTDEVQIDYRQACATRGSRTWPSGERASDFEALPLFPARTFVLREDGLVWGASLVPEGPRPGEEPRKVVPPTRSEAAHLRACAEDIRRSLERFPFEGVEVFDENDRAIARLAHPPVLPESSYDLDADDGLPRRVVVRMKRDVPVEAVTVQQRTWFAIQSVGSDKQPHTIERATGWRSWKAGEGTFSLENPLDALAERPTFPTCRSLSSADASALPCFTGCTPSLQRVEVRLLLRGAPVQSLSFRPHSDC